MKREGYSLLIIFLDEHDSSQMKWSVTTFMSKLKKIIGAAGITASVAFLSKKENRDKLKQQVGQAIDKFTKNTNDNEQRKLVEIANAKMMDEGAMTSVQYYNEKQEEELEEESK